MKKTELIKKIKDKIQYSAHVNVFGQIVISTNSVRNIIKYIEKHLEESNDTK